MKRKIQLISSILIILLAVIFVPNFSTEKAKAQEEPSFVFIVTGPLGDKSFNDSAAEGMNKISEELGFTADIIEIGDDQTQWEPTILDISDMGEYTTIFLNGSGTQEIIERIAPDYPEQKYVLFDAIVEDGSENVLGISYKQNEGSYLGGVLAGLVTASEMDFANEEAKIGFIGGDENPIISDFLVGYIEGAQSVLGDVEVYVSYVGSWTDTARAKELALAQFNEGVDIIFPAAMTAGLGVIEAAAENDKYILGVDSDQALLFEGVDEARANVILTSVMKEVGESLYQYAMSEANGEVEYGTTLILGVAENSTDIVENDYYMTNVPEEIRTQVAEAREGIVNGDIEVSTALGVDQATVEEIINSATP